MPVGSATGRTVLWIVADERNDVAEADETNNESQVIAVLIP
jgi:subtilase family serine protease